MTIKTIIAQEIDKEITKFCLISRQIKIILPILIIVVQTTQQLLEIAN